MNMNMKLGRKSPLLVLSLAALLVACSDFDNGYSESAIEYQETFNGAFGDIASEQDWNAATRVTAQIDLSGVTDGAVDVLVYNANPISGGQLAARYQVEGSSSFQLDLPKVSDCAFVSVVDASGKMLINKYCNIIDGVLTIASPATRSAADANCTTTFGRTVALSDEFTYARYGQEQGTKFGFNVYYLDNVKTEAADAWSVKDMSKIVGQGGTFSRYTPDGTPYSITFNSGYFSEGVNNKELYKDKFKRDIIYKMEQDGPVTVSNQFGGTAFTNQFGYYYYKEGSTAEQTLQNKINARKIVLMQHAEPQNNITVDGVSFTDGMYLPNLVISGYYNGWTPTGFDHALTGNELIQGTKYHLVYFGDDYSDDKATFTFPEGYCIGFFVRTLANYYPLTDETYALCETQGWNIVYSDSELNKYYGKLYEKDNSQGDWEAVTCALNFSTTSLVNNVKNTVTSSCVVAGFEDGVDKDLNDILFFVEGVEVEESFEETVEGQTWVIGCEDLGGSFDYDFNDLVFSVTHIAGDTQATITPLAAGGTLPAYLYNATNDTKLTTKEFHQLWGDDHPYNVQINHRSHGVAGSPVHFTVPSDYTVSYVKDGDNMGGIEIHVIQDGTDETTGTVNLVHSPDKGTAPQMMLIHQADWVWPLEGVSILEAYPEFAAFSEENAPLDWYTRINYSKTVAQASTSTNGRGEVINTGEKVVEKTTPSISANQTEVTLDTYSETTVYISTEGDMSRISCSSNRDDVVCVKSFDASTGALVLQSLGVADEAKITIMHESTSKYNLNYIQIKVTVNASASDDPQEESQGYTFALSDSNPSLYVEGSKEFAFTSTCATWGLSFESSNTDIVNSVTNDYDGTITINAGETSGTATITVTMDDNQSYSKSSQTFTVTVIPFEEHVFAIPADVLCDGFTSGHCYNFSLKGVDFTGVKTVRIYVETEGSSTFTIMRNTDWDGLIWNVSSPYKSGDLLSALKELDSFTIYANDALTLKSVKLLLTR